MDGFCFELQKWANMARVCHDDDAKKKNHCSAQSVIFGMVFSWAYRRQYDLLSCFSWLSGWVGGACVCTIWLCLCFNRKLSEKVMTLLDDWSVLIWDVWGCKGQYMLSKCALFAISDTNAMRQTDFGKTKVIILCSILFNMTSLLCHLKTNTKLNPLSPQSWRSFRLGVDIRRYLILNDSYWISGENLIGTFLHGTRVQGWCRYFDQLYISVCNEPWWK